MSKDQPVILITGTSSGFGREAVKQYAAADFRVVATMRDPKKADASFSQLANVDVEKLDITDVANIADVVNTVVEKYGHLDVLYNNAGYNEVGAFEEVSEAAAQQEMTTNFWGPVNMIRAILPIMRRQGKGHILNMSSMAVYLNLATMAFYSASKAALTSLSETLAKETKQFGIQVTDIEPGGFNTNFGINSKQPAKQMAIYKPIYTENAKFSARVFIEAGLGDLTRAVALIVAQTLKPSAPLHLVVGMQGYHDGRAKLTELIAEYDQNAPLTAKTDPAPEDVNLFKYMYDRAIPARKAEMRALLLDAVLTFQTSGQVSPTALAQLLTLVQPSRQREVQVKVKKALEEYGSR